MTAQQLDQLGGSAEGIRDDLSGGERQRGVDPAFPHRDQMGSGREVARVEFGETPQGAVVEWPGEPQRNRLCRRTGSVWAGSLWSSPLLMGWSVAVIADQCKMLLSPNQS
jgi:hypothetical protein